MKSQLLTVLIILLLAPTILWADRPSINALQTQVNQLNAKVNSLEERLAALEAYPKPYVAMDANGEIIGRLLNLPRPWDKEATVMPRTNEGYTVQLVMHDGAIAGDVIPDKPDNLWRAYEATDCNGEQILGYRTLPIRGVVFESLINGERTGELWYFPIDGGIDIPRVRALSAYSVEQSICFDWSASDEYIYLYDYLPNDPSITGINPTAGPAAYAAPLRFE